MMEDVSKLMQRIQDQDQQIKKLQEAVGKYKRKSKGAQRNFTYVAERHERGTHFISVPAFGAPADLTLHEVQEYVRNNILPQFPLYRYWNVYTSKRYGGWVTTLCREDTTVKMEIELRPLETFEEDENDED